MEDENLTKKEKYLSHREEKEKVRDQSLKTKKIKKAIFIFLPIVFLIFIVALISSNSSPEVVKNYGPANIEIAVAEYDAGTISMADGKISYTYEIINTGEGDLKIDKIWTSCMCTTAKLKVGDKESIEFGMHDNPRFWSQIIAPGEKGFLEVTFDPAFHGPDGTGPIVRAVYLATNDSNREQVMVKLMANVIR